MAGVEYDFTELNELGDDILKAAGIGQKVRKAVEVTARKVKDSTREKVRGRRHFRQAASAIDYELIGFQGFGATVLDAEIGYNKDYAAGKLGNLIEYGAPGASNQLAPGSELQRSLTENEDDLEQGIIRAVHDTWDASRL